jgi:hypothetical protein
MTDPRKGQTSASSAQADALCPGRHLAQVGMPDVRSKDSAFGDAIHAVLASLPNQNQKPPSSAPPSIQVLHSLPGFAVLTPSQQEIAESCLKIELEKVHDFFGQDAPQALGRCWREQRQWVRVSPTAEHSGQVDVFYRLGPRGLVIDYKSLAGDKPESPENLQLRDLVCLVAGHFMVSQVGCVIVQPLATHSPNPCLYEKEDITRSTQEMFERVLNSNNPQSPRNPGEVQCEFCRAKSKCTEYNRWAASRLPIAANLVDVPILSWTPEQRAAFCDSFDIAQDWLAGCWNFMEVGMKNDPTFVPGYVMKPNSPMKPVTNPQELYTRLCQYGSPDEILPLFMDCITVTKEKVSVVLSGLTGLKGKALDKKSEELFAGLTGEIPKKATLKKAK